LGRLQKYSSKVELQSLWNGENERERERKREKEKEREREKERENTEML